MKIFVSVILISLSCNTFAQNHLIGITGGISWSNIHSKEISAEAYRTGFRAGLSYENRIMQNIILGVDLIYQQRGFGDELYLTDMYGDLLKEYEFKFNYEYLAIPLKGGFIFGDKLSGFGNIGLAPSVLINATLKYPYDLLDDDFDLRESTKKFDLAGLLEAGGNLQLSENLLISVSFVYQEGLTTFFNSNYFVNTDARHFSFNLSGGIRYVLK